MVPTDRADDALPEPTTAVDNQGWLIWLSWVGIMWSAAAWPVYLITWSESGMSRLASGVYKDISPAITIAFILLCGGAWVLAMVLGVTGLLRRRPLALLAAGLALACAMSFLAFGTF